MRTRAIVVDNKQRVAWDERLVLEAPSQKGQTACCLQLVQTLLYAVMDDLTCSSICCFQILSVGTPLAFS